MLEIRFGDSVIVPLFTFTSAALAFANSGADLKFCDIHPLTLGLDPELVEQAIDPTVKGIVTVHYAGVPSAPDQLRQIGDRHGIFLIETTPTVCSERTTVACRARSAQDRRVASTRRRTSSVEKEVR